MTGTVAPGKECIVALKNLMFLIIESPTIGVVGENSGCGVRDIGCGLHRGKHSPVLSVARNEEAGWFIQTLNL